MWILNHISTFLRIRDGASYDSLEHFPYSDRPIFTKLDEMIETSKRIHSIHFGVVPGPNQSQWRKLFKVTPVFKAEYLRNGTRYRRSYNEMLVGTYALLKNVISKWP